MKQAFQPLIVQGSTNEILIDEDMTYVYSGKKIIRTQTLLLKTVSLFVFKRIRKILGRPV